jgi:hypothetical protein
MVDARGLIRSNDLLRPPGLVRMAVRSTPWL